MANQTTLRRAVTLAGIGQHKGTENIVHIMPAPENGGIVFRLRRGGAKKDFPLSVENVFGEAGYTSIGEKVGFSLKTIEHVVSAIHGLSLDNLMIDTDSLEMPIFDGSALPVFKKLAAAGSVEQGAPRRAIKVLRRVEFMDEKAAVSLEPASRGLSLDIEIDYPGIRPIGRQHIALDLTRENYERIIAPARTFARMSDVEFLHSKGLALGASMKSGIAVDEERVLNPEGLRAPDEFVAHKALDAVGDLYAAGRTLVGAYKSLRGGHYHNGMLMKKLLSDPANFEIVEA
ncbi:MAG: UDP-3-O-acyl-N-acetylglucosamine deacetylase [Rickettsiales bacterium]|jgi:UDP-3-O-[3-hydroxymyristoyl] N-acetylglucosamine deacetylase|nr:UDP-3-O-acyl-N-acetylglucosamine deacetylase [Rickettsiales bacterium]